MTNDDTTAGRIIRMPIIAGATALALAAAMLISTQGGATADESRATGPAHAGTHQERAHNHQDGERTMSSEHLAGVADAFGVDADVLAETMTALRAEFDGDRSQMRGEMADLDRDERRAAMVGRSEERKALMTQALADLGVDPDALAQHHAEHGGEHRAGQDHGDRAQRQQHGGQRSGGPHGQV